MPRPWPARRRSAVRRKRAELKAREEAERKGRQEAEARAAAERKAREAAEQRAREHAEAVAREAEARRAREAIELKAREEAARQAHEDAEARVEVERKARKDAERQAKLEASKRAEMERKAREEAERLAGESTARAREEARAERKARELAERRAAEERKAREQAERRAREESSRRAAAEARVKQEAERHAREASRPKKAVIVKKAKRRQAPEPVRERTPKKEPARPTQDEWGLYDPDKAGFGALFAKLDAIDNGEPVEDDPSAADLLAAAPETTRSSPRPLSMWVWRADHGEPPRRGVDAPADDFRGLVDRLNIPVGVAAVRYASGVRIRRVKVTPGDKHARSKHDDSRVIILRGRCSRPSAPRPIWRQNARTHDASLDPSSLRSPESASRATWHTAIPLPITRAARAEARGGPRRNGALRRPRDVASRPRRRAGAVHGVHPEHEGRVRHGADACGHLHDGQPGKRRRTPRRRGASAPGDAERLLHRHEGSDLGRIRRVRVQSGPAPQAEAGAGHAH